jgi:hypothetical protein
MAKNLDDRGFKFEAQKARNLATDLNKYMISPRMAFDHEIFIQACTEPLKDARKILETHRGWNHILANVALAIAGLGVFYGVAVLINKARTGNFFFFQKTDSIKKIDHLEGSIGSIQSSIQTY